MFKWVWAAIIVIMLTIPISAQTVTTAKIDIPAFRSLDLLIDCVAQFAMGNSDFMRNAIIQGDIILVPKGTVIITGTMLEAGVFTFMVKGKTGIWFSSIGLCEGQ